MTLMDEKKPKVLQYTEFRFRGVFKVNVFYGIFFQRNGSNKTSNPVIVLQILIGGSIDEMHSVIRAEVDYKIGRKLLLTETLGHFLPLGDLRQEARKIERV